LQRQVETKKEHKAILTRRTNPVFPTAGSACKAQQWYPEINYQSPSCCGVHRTDALDLGWTEYPPHVRPRETKKIMIRQKLGPLFDIVKIRDTGYKIS